MKFGYTVFYVEDVPKTLDHYQVAFGCELRFLHDGKMYGELETGATVLAFAANEMAEMNDIAIRESDPKDVAASVNITFVTEDVQSAYDHAVKNGAAAVMPPTTKPWGQISSYVRDRDGHLVEIASPVGDAQA